MGKCRGVGFSNCDIGSPAIAIDGSKTTGWRLIDNKWYFFNNNTGAMVKGWYKSELGEWTYDKKDTIGQWFHLGTDGKMDIGWFKDTDGVHGTIYVMEETTVL